MSPVKTCVDCGARSGQVVRGRCPKCYMRKRRREWEADQVAVPAMAPTREAMYGPENPWVRWAKAQDQAPDRRPGTDELQKRPFEDWEAP